MKKTLKPLFFFLAKRFSYFEKLNKNSALIRTPLGLTLINFFCQRILRINTECKIPINFTSRITSYKNISLHNDLTTLLSFSSSGGAYIQAINGIQIGENFLFAPGIRLISANHDFINRNKPLKSSPIIIGNNVWIGSNAIILPGVQIGDNCIIGAGSIVTKSFKANNMIIAGNPAKEIKRY